MKSMYILLIKSCFLLIIFSYLPLSQTKDSWNMVLTYKKEKFMKNIIIHYD